MIVTEKELLSLHTTFKIGGPADFFIVADSEEDVHQGIIFAEEKKLPWFCIGNGSNTLFSDEGFRGVVIKNNIKKKEIEQCDSFFGVCVGAGEEWDQFVLFCVEHKMYGLENLSLIPGTVGASVVQNIGAYGVEVKDLVLRVRVFDCIQKKVVELSREECLFGYRDSVFKKDVGKKYIVLSVFFTLQKEWTPCIRYKDLEFFFEGRTPSSKEVRDAVITIREAKFPSLTRWGTAGSYFKNPVISDEQAFVLKNKFPLLPVFDFLPGKKKISVAWILDNVLSLRGYKEEKVFLFEKQPLVLTVEKGATAIEVKKFVEKIKKLFFDATGILLEEEVVHM